MSIPDTLGPYTSRDLMSSYDVANALNQLTIAITALAGGGGGGGGGGLTPSGSDGDIQIRAATALAAITRAGGVSTDYLARDNSYRSLPILPVPAGADGDVQLKSGTSLAAISRFGGALTDYLAKDNTYKTIPSTTSPAGTDGDLQIKAGTAFNALSRTGGATSDYLARDNAYHTLPAGFLPAGSDGDIQTKAGANLSALSRAGGVGTDYLARDNSYKTIPSGTQNQLTIASRTIAMGTTFVSVGLGGPSTIRTLAYATAADGGGATYTRVSSAPSYSSLIWFQSADGQYWSMLRVNEPLRLEQAGGGVSASGANNNAAASALMGMFGAADDQSGYAYPGPNIQLGYGVYNFASAWIVRGTCNIHGLGSGGDSGYGTILKFPVNSDGLVFGWWKSNGRGYNSSGDWSQGAAGSVTRDLTIRGGWDGSTQPRTAANPTGPWGIGYLAKCPTVAINVNVQKFPEQGFYTIGTSGGGSFTQTDEPNIVTEGGPNSFSYYSCRAGSNGLDGFKDRGADANAGTYFECSSHDNGQWGFNILNFLGNSLYGCHTTTNAQKIATDPVTGKAVSHYQCAGSSQVTSVIGCYGENDPNKNFFDQNCFVMGGLLANGNTGTATIIYPQAQYTSPLHVLESASHITSGLSMTLQPGDINDAYMFWGMNDDRGSWWSYQSGNITQHAGAIAFNDHGWAFTGKNNTQQCGRSAAIANGNMIFPNGIFLAGRGTDGSSVQYGDARFVGTLPGLPTAGKWARGDRIHMRDPSAGGIPGYVCTTGGDYSATPPVWKAMGNLAA